MWGWAPKPAHRLRLPPHPHPRRLVQPFRLDQGEGYLAIQQSIEGQVDLLLAPLPQELLYLVAAVDEGSRPLRGSLCGGRRGRRASSSNGRRAERLAALPAELGARFVDRLAGRAGRLQRRGALGAKPAPPRVVVTASRTLHRQHLLARGTDRWYALPAQATICTPVRPSLYPRATPCQHRKLSAIRMQTPARGGARTFGSGTVFGRAADSCRRCFLAVDRAPGLAGRARYRIRSRSLGCQPRDPQQSRPSLNAVLGLARP